MSKVRVLSSNDINEITNIDEVIEAVKIAYQQKASANGEDFPMIFHEFKHKGADMDIKSGVLTDPSIFGLKVVSLHESNPRNDLPLLMSTTLVFEAQTGELKGLLNFEHLTGIRTAAAAAIGALLLARNDSKTFLLVGCGHLSVHIIRAINHKFPNLEKIMVYEPISADNAKKLQEQLCSEQIDVTIMSDLEEATKLSDIIVTATPSRNPLIKNEWVKEGTHLSCIGSDMSGKNEIEGSLLKRAKLYVDDLRQSLSVGEFELAYHNKIIDDKTLFCDIGAIIIDEKNGRTSSKDITIFDSTGISLQDIMVANMLIEEAEKKNIGQEITF